MKIKICYYDYGFKSIKKAFDCQREIKAMHLVHWGKIGHTRVGITRVSLGIQDY